MLWTYVILGLLAAAASLYRLVFALVGRGRSWAVHAFAMLLLAGAWLFEHRTTEGWACLLGAILVEIIVSVLLRQGEIQSPFSETALAHPEIETAEVGEPLDEEVLVSQESVAGESAESPDTSSDAAGAPLVEDASVQPNVKLHIDATQRTFFTLAFLTKRYEMSAGVFLASLRRWGQRDATYLDTDETTDTARFGVGAIQLSAQVTNQPCNLTEIDAAVGQNWERPKALETVSRHVAHVFFISSFSGATPRDQVVRLHHRAHAALAEFAPVIAVLWPDAGRLVPLDRLDSLAKQSTSHTADISNTCTTCRVFPLDGENAGMFLSDSIGLHAFGVPDVQLVTQGRPDEFVAGAMHQLVDRFFMTGCEMEDGGDVDLGDGRIWRVKKVQSTFTPDRVVMQFVVVRNPNNDEK